MSADLLYEGRKKIYPREVKGLFSRLRSFAVFFLLALYFVLPWFEIKGKQAVLFDLAARKFHVFGYVFWPQDFLFLAFILIILAFSLFFFTALAGRLWCGYSCPQTVWTEMFLWIERLVEGSRIKQINLDKSRLSVEKFVKKAIKHTLWFFVAGLTAFAFVAYFSSAKDLMQNLFAFKLGSWEAFWLFFFTVATYINSGWMREQVCKYMCPYARFQSAMFDKNTLIISYDESRGEPRGKKRVNLDTQAENSGNCINCTMCVQVCPTGIDIRNGLQYECIGCAACIDACDEVMDKINYPKGLIRYSTQNAMEGKPSKIIRPRIIIYILMLSILSGAFIYALSNRNSIELDVIRDRNQLYRESEGWVENIYTLKLINMDQEPHYFDVEVKGIEGLTLLLDKKVVEVEAGSVYDLPVRLRAKEQNLKKRSTEINFIITSSDNKELSSTQKAKFLGPISSK